MVDQVRQLVAALGGDPTQWNQADMSEIAIWYQHIARQLRVNRTDACVESCDTFAWVGFLDQGSTHYLLRLLGAPFATWSTTHEAGKIDPCAAPARARELEYGLVTLLNESLLRTRLTIKQWVDIGCERRSLLTWFHPNSRPSVAEVCFNNYD
ncbi:MAG: hypothetical protein RIE77_10610 [Phycisphaerales bacterium]|jgi:hypothetical protein